MTDPFINWIKMSTWIQLEVKGINPNNKIISFEGGLVWSLMVLCVGFMLDRNRIVSMDTTQSQYIYWLTQPRNKEDHPPQLTGWGTGWAGGLGGQEMTLLWPVSHALNSFTWWGRELQVCNHCSFKLLVAVGCVWIQIQRLRSYNLVGSTCQLISYHKGEL